MKIRSCYTRLSVVALSFIVCASVVSAQSYYDDDIYYDPSKAKKEQPQKKEVTQKAAQQAQAQQYYYDGAAYVPWSGVGDYQSADTYLPEGTSMRDVDEYNRRTVSSHSQATVSDSISLAEFTRLSNTRNLARFHDSEAALEAYSENYVDAGYDGYSAQNTISYDGAYSSPAATSVNINLYGGYPYCAWPYYRSTWYTWYADPFCTPSWGYYDPYWAWSWGWGGPSWSWAWNYGWSHGWAGPAWAGPVRPYYRPQSAPGGHRPRPTTAHGSNGRYTSGRYGTGNNNSSVRYPATTNSRPGYRAPIGTAPSSGSSATPSTTRGRNSHFGTNGNSNRNTNTNYNRSNNSNYRQSRPSSGSSSSGRSGGFSSGGSRSGGGGHRSR